MKWDANINAYSVLLFPLNENFSHRVWNDSWTKAQCCLGHFNREPKINVHSGPFWSRRNKLANHDVVRNCITIFATSLNKVTFPRSEITWYNLRGQHRHRLTMLCMTILTFFLLQTSAVLCDEENFASRRSSLSAMRANKQLKGYVVKHFDSPSLLSCVQQCTRYAWCTSTNYKMSSKKDGKGTCELNKHDISLINPNAEFHDQQGVTFSMLMKVITIRSHKEIKIV